MAERLAKFGLELHPDKTRVLRFGRYAREKCKREGRTRPETFDFLGFTHIAGQARNGGFQLQRRTSRKKRAAKLSELRAEMRRRRHEPATLQHGWLCSVIRLFSRICGRASRARVGRRANDRGRFRRVRSFESRMPFVL
jgi:RNA-directed DNA polymerase